MTMRVRLTLLAFFAVLCCGLAGCGSKPPVASEDRADARNIRNLMSIWRKHGGEHNLNYVKSTDELKAWALKQPKTKWEEFKIEDISKVFVSPRDGQQMQCVAVGKGPPARVVLYEAKGVDGKRYTMSMTGNLEEMDDQKFHSLVPGAK